MICPCFLTTLTSWPNFIGLCARSEFPDQGSNLCPLQWKHRVLTTGPRTTRDIPISLLQYMYLSLDKRLYSTPQYLFYIYQNAYIWKNQNLLIVKCWLKLVIFFIFFTFYTSTFTETVTLKSMENFYLLLMLSLNKFCVLALKLALMEIIVIK